MLLQSSLNLHDMFKRIIIQKKLTEYIFNVFPESPRVPLLFFMLSYPVTSSRDFGHDLRTMRVGMRTEFLTRNFQSHFLCQKLVLVKKGI